MERTKHTSTIIKWGVLIVLVAAIGMLPIGAELTPTIKLFFMISVACIGMFAMSLFQSPMIPSLILMFAYTSISDLGTIMSGWANDTPWCVICVLIILQVMHNTPLLKRISYHCILFTGASYVGICVAIYLVGLICSFLGDSTCCALIGLSAGIVTSVGRQFGMKKPTDEERRAAAGILLCAYFGITDAGMFILNPNVVPFAYGMAHTVSDSIPTMLTYVEWLKYNLVYIPYYIILLALIIVFFKPKNSMQRGGKPVFRAELEKLGPMTKEEKKLSVVLIALFIYLITTTFHGQRITYGFVAAAALLFFPGIGVGTGEDIKNVNFSYPVFIVACLSIGAVATSLGVGTMLVNLLMPHLNASSALVFFLAIAVIVFLINFVMTPGAIYSLLMIPLAGVTINLPFVNHVQPLIVAMLVGMNAVLMPYETANTLMLYSFDILRMKDFLRGFGIKAVLSFVWLIFAVMYWSAIGLLG